MITVKLNMANFEYDIHSLVKAFFPAEDIIVSAEYKEVRESISFHIDVEYSEDSIQITFWDIPQEIHKEEDLSTKKQIENVDNYKEIKKDCVKVEFSDRTETKNQLKQLLYHMLCDYTKTKLPWGTLTGIRPTKIPMKMFEEGKTREEIRTYMEDTYFAEDEKIELSMEDRKSVV